MEQTLATPANPETETDRVRRQTSPETLGEIDRKIEQSIAFYSTQPAEAITERIEKLQHEWSIERRLECNASVLAFTGTFLGLTVSKRWLIVPLVVSGFLFQHAVEGWCPPLPVLRKLGYRTRGEIDREIVALKILRGDFKNLNADLSDHLQNIRTLIAEINALK